jgi:hypothetical protein
MRLPLSGSIFFAQQIRRGVFAFYVESGNDGVEIDNSHSSVEGDLAETGTFPQQPDTVCNTRLVILARDIWTNTQSTELALTFINDLPAKIHTHCSIGLKKIGE